MIISTNIQAATRALEIISDEAEQQGLEPYSVLATLDIGPRAMAQFTTRLAEDADEPTEAIMRAFLTGVIAERLTANIDLGIVPEEAVLDLAGDDEAYEGANLEDVRDTLQVLYGVDTPDEASEEEVRQTLKDTMQEGQDSLNALMTTFLQSFGEAFGISPEDLEPPEEAGGHDVV